MGIYSGKIQFIKIERKGTKMLGWKRITEMGCR